MLAEPKTKRARPELNLGLFGMGPLGHLQGLAGLDPTGKEVWFVGCGRGVGCNARVWRDKCSESMYIGVPGPPSGAGRHWTLAGTGRA
jgi:hypothetical protein